MNTLVSIISLVGLILLVIAVIAARKRDPLAQLQAMQTSAPHDPFFGIAGAATFTPDNLRPGTVISHKDKDYVVQATLVFKQETYTWFKHKLDDDTHTTWLSAEVGDGQLRLVWWTPQEQALHPTPTLELEGVTYRESERGHAAYMSLGATGMPNNGTMRYVDFVDITGSYRLVFEGWSEEDAWEMSTGRTVEPGELTIRGA